MPLSKPYGIFFTSAPSSTSLAEVPVVHDWEENIDKVTFLHKIKSQAKTELHLLQFLRQGCGNPQSSFIKPVHFQRIHMLLSSSCSRQQTCNCIVSDCCGRLQVRCGREALSLPFASALNHYHAASTTGGLGMPLSSSSTSRQEPAYNSHLSVVIFQAASISNLPCQDH